MASGVQETTSPFVHQGKQRNCNADLLMGGEEQNDKQNKLATLVQRRGGSYCASVRVRSRFVWDSLRPGVPGGIRQEDYS
jgi:hypothetical protein